MESRGTGIKVPRGAVLGGEDTPLSRNLRKEFARKSGTESKITLPSPLSVSFVPRRVLSSVIK